MELRRVISQEPTRSRLLIAIGGVLTIANTAGLIWADISKSGWWFIGGSSTWLVLLLAIGFLMLRANLKMTDPAARHRLPMRFVLTNSRFAVAPFLSPGLTAATQLMLAGCFLAILVQRWLNINDPDPALRTMNIVFTGLFLMGVGMMVTLTAATVVSAWRGFSLELTPAGVYVRGPLFQRLVPWEALAPGGPLRPHLNAKQLCLTVARPELVVQRGVALGFGSRERPMVHLQVDMHPWFLADAIRWYVEHSDDRAAIGTHDEHQRLIAELTAPASAYQPAPYTRPPRPAAVSVAIGLTYAGVALGLLSAATDLVIAIVFRDQFRAAEQAMLAEETRMSSEPVGETIGTAGDFATEWAIGFLLLAVVLGAVAVLLARQSTRGSGQARIGLVVLSGLVAAWALCPCGPPSLGLTESPDASILGGAVLAAWLVQRGAMMIFAASVAVLLLLPVASQYFRITATETNLVRTPSLD